MPRYFVDIYYGDVHFKDDSGTEMPSIKAARDEVLKILPDIARGVVVDGGVELFIATVRDASGIPVFTTSLSVQYKLMS